MSIRIGILGVPTSPYAVQLQLAAHEMGLQTRLINFHDLQAGISFADTTRVSSDVGSAHEDQSCQRVHLERLPTEPQQLDAVIVRSMPLGSLEQVIFRMDCLQIWQAQGIAVVNSPRCLETSIDKWLTLHRLSQAGVLVPPTVSCQTRDQALDAFERLGKDVLVKPLFGGEGRGIIRVQNEDLAWRTFSTLQQLGQVLYLQQWIPNSGYDIRVLWVGEQAFSIRRTARQGEYRTNISQGGLAQNHQLTELQREVSWRAAGAVDGSVVGVDLLPARDSRLYVLEVNAVPGWKAVSACLKVDVAHEVIQFVNQRVRLGEASMVAGCGR